MSDKVYNFDWVPKYGREYYFPRVDRPEKYEVGIWVDDEIDNARLKRGIIHKTKKQAIAHAGRMLKA